VRSLVQEESDGDAAAREVEKVRCALQVVHRQWEAAEENSRRLTTRANGILATIAAASGLGLFKLSDLPAIQPVWVAWVMRGSLGVTALCILIGLIHIWDVRPPADQDEGWWCLGRKAFRALRTYSRRPGEAPEDQKPKHPFASSLLHTTGQPGTDLPIQDPDLLTLEVQAIREIEYYRTAMAAIDLHARNVERQAGIERGQAWLFRAAYLAFLAAVVTLAFGQGRGS
jgi:hypothetical protein